MHNLIPHIIKGGAFTYNFFSNLFNMPGPNDDPFTTLVCPTVRGDVASYATSFYQFALCAKEPEFSIQSRFVVPLVGINKAETSAQHESLAVWVNDTDTGSSYEFIIERAPSKHPFYDDRFTIFCKSESDGSEEVLACLKNAISGTQSIVVESFFSTGPETDTDLPLSLPPLTDTPSVSHS